MWQNILKTNPYIDSLILLVADNLYSEFINENLNIKLFSNVRCSIFSFYSYCDMNWFIWIEFQMMFFSLVNCWLLGPYFMEISHVNRVRQGYRNCLFICLMAYVSVGSTVWIVVEHSIHFHSAQMNFQTLAHSIAVRDNIIILYHQTDWEPRTLNGFLLSMKPVTGDANVLILRKFQTK